MSFREQRNFIEILRNLGYGHTIRCARPLHPPRRAPPRTAPNERTIFVP